MQNSDVQTRDMAVNALARIDAHITTCDRRYEDWQKRQDQTLNYLKDIHEKMNGLSDQIAEARGAGKMAKVITSGIAAASGFFGGLGSHIAIK